MSSTQVVIVIRRSTSQDNAAREELVRNSFSAHNLNAFLLFFFQELTLQVTVLVGAVLFIFCGVSVAGCCLLVPALALIVLISVRLGHAVLADKHVQSMRKEEYGIVAELQAPLLVDPATCTIHIEHQLEQTNNEKAPYKQIIGTVSVSEFWGPKQSGWLHGLAVTPNWGRRGVGAALVKAAREHAAKCGLESLEAIVSQLQSPARQLLHRAGWEVRGAYHRQLFGAALTLSLVHLGTDLPFA